MDEFEHPTRGDVLDEQREFGEGQSEQVVELVDEACALSDNGLKSPGDLAQRAQLGGQRRRVCRSFADRVACGGAGLDGIGLLVAEERGAVVFIALWIAAGDTDGRDLIPARRAREGVQEVQQIVRILPRGIESDDEVDDAVTLDKLLQALSEA